MRFFQRFFKGFTLALLALTMTSMAQAAGPGYVTLSDPQPTESGKKVEVTEFFWYNCSHCNAFDPVLHEWVKKQGDAISFKRVPVSFRPDFIPQQKMYYALEAMGQLESMHSKIFDAIHKNRQKIDTDAAILDFVSKNGVDKVKFQDAYNSFSVQAKVSRAAKLQAAYKVDGVPLVAIDGRYLTSPGKAMDALGNVSEHELMLGTMKIMDTLVAKSKK